MGPTNERDESYEYVHVQLHNGESTRFKRTWGGYRFTDQEVDLLIHGYEIAITTETVSGIRGSLDWQEYEGHEYYGFAPWDAESYTIDNAPIPLMWSTYTFEPEELDLLRTGEKVLITPRKKDGYGVYAVHVTFELIDRGDRQFWGIEPHFDEFERPANSFSRKTCLFMPIFSDRKLTQREIAHVRAGGSIDYEGVSRHGNPYKCRLHLKLDKTDRWRLTPTFY